MPDVERLRAAVKRVAAAAGVRVDDVLRRVDGLPAEQARAVLIEALSAIASTHGQVAAAAAADWYDSARSAGGFTAVPADAVTAEQVEGTSRYAVGLILAGGAAAAGPTLVGAVDRWVQGAARATILRSAALDPRRPVVASIPSGADTCDVCMSRAARGYVPVSESSLDGFHDGCDCHFAPRW